MLRDNSQKTETILYINLFLRLLVIHIEHFIFFKKHPKRECSISAGRRVTLSVLKIPKVLFLSAQGPLVRWLKVNFSEAFIAWIHIKALRVFVESVLR